MSSTSDGVFSNLRRKGNRRRYIRVCRARSWSRPERIIDTTDRWSDTRKTKCFTESHARVLRSRVAVADGSIDRIALARPKRCGLADRRFHEAGLLGSKRLPACDRSSGRVDDVGEVRTSNRFGAGNPELAVRQI